jgi:RNA-directed DNA polymerase
VYLHWFDRAFCAWQRRQSGMLQARLVRYADDFVVLCRRLTPELIGFIEFRLEGQMGLIVNRTKTRRIELREPKTRLNFLGYSLSFNSRRGANHRPLLIEASRESLHRERAKLRDLIQTCHSHVPLPELLAGVTRQLQGWGQYFCYGHCAHPFRQINFYTERLLYCHLRRRSQRGYKPAQDVPFGRHLAQLGLQPTSPV